MNEGGYYCPPMRDLTSEFCRQVLSGEKKLMKSSEVLWVEEVPQWEEFTAKRIWERVKRNESVNIYFPNYSGSKTPQRKYLLNIVNTIDKNSVKKHVKDIRRQREKDLIKDQPICLTKEFFDLFS